MSRAGEHRYYMVTFQKKVFPTHANSPKICYRNITEQGDPEYV